MSKLGKRLINAADEALAIARGEADPKAYRIHAPVDVRAIRRQLGLSQTQFAHKFRIATATIRDWEQHGRVPEGPARVLLQVIKCEPKAVERALKTET